MQDFVHQQYHEITDRSVENGKAMRVTVCVTCFPTLPKQGLVSRIRQNRILDIATPPFPQERLQFCRKSAIHVARECARSFCCTGGYAPERSQQLHEAHGGDGERSKASLWLKCPFEAVCGFSKNQCLWFQRLWGAES